MDYTNFIAKHTSAKIKLHRPKKMIEIERIEALIEKKLPQEIIDFYSFSDGLEWETQNAFEEKIPSIDKLFGNYKKPILANLLKDESALKEELKRLSKNPFKNKLWYSNYAELSKCAYLQTIEGVNYFNKLLNLKPLLFFSCFDDNLAIDFSDASKAYQIYYQDRIELYPLNIDFQTFMKIFLQIGITEKWFWAFIDKEARPDWHQEVDYDSIKKDFPNFDLKQLKLKN
ncbi:MAG: hypothetical protein RL264_477 [Bacteroidota bacterium]|jgi:hypothetical protein